MTPEERKLHKYCWEESQDIHKRDPNYYRRFCKREDNNIRKVREKTYSESHVVVPASQTLYCRNKRKNLTDTYIKVLIKARFNISPATLSLYPEFVENYRMQIKFKRLLKNKKK